jgi:hypothetical protein
MALKLNYFYIFYAMNSAFCSFQADENSSLIVAVILNVFLGGWSILSGPDGCLDRTLPRRVLL